MARYLKPNALGKVAKLVQNDPSPGPPGARYARPFYTGETPSSKRYILVGTPKLSFFKTRG